MFANTAPTGGKQNCRLHLCLYQREDSRVLGETRKRDFKIAWSRRFYDLHMLTIHAPNKQPARGRWRHSGKEKAKPQCHSRLPLRFPGSRLQMLSKFLSHCLLISMQPVSATGSVTKNHYELLPCSAKPSTYTGFAAWVVLHKMQRYWYEPVYQFSGPNYSLGSDDK